MLIYFYSWWQRLDVNLRELLYLLGPLVLNVSAKGFVHKLLCSIHHGQISLSLRKLGVQIKLHELFEAFISILSK